jgi:hypothetical protein
MYYAKGSYHDNYCYRVAEWVNQWFWCIRLTHPRLTTSNLTLEDPKKIDRHCIVYLYMRMLLLCVAGKVIECGRWESMKRDKPPSNSNSVEDALARVWLQQRAGLSRCVGFTRSGNRMMNSLWHFCDKMQIHSNALLAMQIKYTAIYKYDKHGLTNLFGFLEYSLKLWARHLL